MLVTPRWGPNTLAEPVAHARAAARTLLEGGATLIAGHSAHVFHGLDRRILYASGISWTSTRSTRSYGTTSGSSSSSTSLETGWKRSRSSSSSRTRALPTATTPRGCGAAPAKPARRLGRRWPKRTAA
ncbi:MAG: CapA family protein [Gaiellaceae bacterium]